jgi:hypothetical protein
MRLILVFVGILAGALAAYVAVTGYFLAKAATNLLTVGAIASAITLATPPEDPLALGYRGDPQVALGLPFQTLTVETALGPTEAWLVPAAGAEVGRAIYVHGIAGAREDGYRHLSLLHEAGWSVLLVTYRNDPGAPEATSGLYAFGLEEWEDLEAALLAFDTFKGPGVLVVAESMGGAVLGQFLSRSAHADRVMAVALDSPALSFRAVLAHLAGQSGNPLPRPMAWAATHMLPALTGLPLTEAEVAATYAAFPGPMFLAHGTGDRIVPIAPTQDLAATRPADRTVTLWTGADHLGSYAEDPAAYGAAFARFLAQLPR